MGRQLKKQNTHKYWTRRIFKTAATGKFFHLFVSLILLFLISPFFENRVHGKLIFSIVLSLILFSGLRAVSVNRRQTVIAFALMAPAFVFSWAPFFKDIHLFNILAAISGMAFFVYVAIRVLSYILKGQEVTTDTIYGAINVYLMLGVTWAFSYRLVEIFSPGSFSIPQTNIMGNVPGLSDFLYFSFTTLTTTGYGDIHPIGSFSRTLANLESITGVLFVAVLIGRFVGMRRQTGSLKE